MSSTNGYGAQPERVALYMRVSSEEQKTKETIEIQDDFLEEYCKLYRHEVARVFIDAAVSGTVPLHERPAGRELLEDARAGKFDVVLVYRLDRIGRSLVVVIDAHDRLQEAGAALRSATEPIDTSTPAGRLIFQMLASFSEFEKEAINERTRAGKHRVYRGGAQPGVIPYGYEISEDGHFARTRATADARGSTRCGSRASFGRISAGSLRTPARSWSALRSRWKSGAGRPANSSRGSPRSQSA